MAILIPVSTALVITISSREVTAIYPNFYGLYDLAIAGNEYAVAKLNNDTLSVDDLPFVRAWSFQAIFTMPGGHVVNDIFQAVTTVAYAPGSATAPAFNDMTVTTTIFKVADGAPGYESADEIPHKITVGAQIYLDGCRLAMVELMRWMN